MREISCKDYIEELLLRPEAKKSTSRLIQLIAVRETEPSLFANSQIKIATPMQRKGPESKMRLGSRK